MFGHQLTEKPAIEPKRYSFIEKHEQMLEDRALLDVQFYPRFAYQGHWVFVGGHSRGSVHIQRDAHIDTIVQITDQGYTLTIDEKIDTKNRYTIFAETVSMKEYDKPGWMVPGVSKADLLLWAFPLKRPTGLRVHTFWLELLIKWFWPRKSMYPQFEILNENGRRWTTIGHQVPIRDIPACCYFKDKEIVEAQLSLF